MKQRIPGPYTVLPHSPLGPWEVMEDKGATIAELRPRKVYTSRQSAYGLMARWNKKHSQAGKRT